MDESALGNRLATLAILQTDLEELLERIRAARTAMLAIEGPAPLDKDTRQPMTDARRQEIFDAWTAESEAVLKRRPVLPDESEYLEPAPPPPPELAAAAAEESIEMDPPPPLDEQKGQPS